LSDKTII